MNRKLLVNCCTAYYKHRKLVSSYLQNVTKVLSHCHQEDYRSSIHDLHMTLDLSLHIKHFLNYTCYFQSQCMRIYGYRSCLLSVTWPVLPFSSYINKVYNIPGIKFHCDFSSRAWPSQTELENIGCRCWWWGNFHRGHYHHTHLQVQEKEWQGQTNTIVSTLCLI